MGSVRGVDSLLTFSEISESEVEVERLLDKECSKARKCSVSEKEMECPVTLLPNA